MEESAPGNFDKPIVVEIEMAKTFYKAEDYHQNYVELNSVTCHVNIPRAKKAIGFKTKKSELEKS